MNKVQSQFEVWKTLEFDTTMINSESFQTYVRSCNNSSEIKKRMLNRQLMLSMNANDTLLGINSFEYYNWVKLVRVSLQDLGFKTSVSREQIYAKIKEFGLRKCCSQIGLKLRLQYLDQPAGEDLIVGMKPATFNSSRNIFSLDATVKKLWLRALCGNAQSFWKPSSEWVFIHSSG